MAEPLQTAADDPWAPIDDPWAETEAQGAADPWAPVDDPWAPQEPEAPVAAGPAPAAQPSLATTKVSSMLDLVGGFMRDVGKVRWGDAGPEIVNQTLTRLKLGAQGVKQAGLDLASDTLDDATGLAARMNPDEKALYQWVRDETNRRAIKPAMDKVTGQTQEIAARGAQFSQDFMPDQNFAERAITGGASSVAGTAPLLAAAVATRQPGLVLGPMAAITGAETYATERAQGETPADATLNAALQTGIEYWTERLPTMALLDVKSSAGKAVLEFIWKDLVGEQLATAGQNAVEQLVGEIHQPMTVQDFLQSQLDTLGATLVAGPLQAAGPYALARGRQLAEERKKEAARRFPIKVPPPPRVDTEADTDPWAPVEPRGPTGPQAIEGELQPRLTRTTPSPFEREINETARRNRPRLEAPKKALPAPGSGEFDQIDAYLKGEVSLDDALGALDRGLKERERDLGKQAPGGPSGEPRAPVAAAPQEGDITPADRTPGQRWMDRETEATGIENLGSMDRAALSGEAAGIDRTYEAIPPGKWVSGDDLKKAYRAGKRLDPGTVVKGYGRATKVLREAGDIEVLHDADGRPFYARKGTTPRKGLGTWSEDNKTFTPAPVPNDVPRGTEPTQKSEAAPVAAAKPAPKDEKPAGTFVPPIVTEMVEAGRESARQLRERIDTVRFGPEGKNVVAFQFDGKSWSVPATNDTPVFDMESTKAWLVRQILDGKAKPVARNRRKDLMDSARELAADPKLGQLRRSILKSEVAKMERGEDVDLDDLQRRVVSAAQEIDKAKQTERENETDFDKRARAVMQRTTVEELEGLIRKLKRGRTKAPKDLAELKRQQRKPENAGAYWQDLRVAERALEMHREQRAAAPIEETAEPVTVPATGPETLLDRVSVEPDLQANLRQLAQQAGWAERERVEREAAEAQEIAALARADREREQFALTGSDRASDANPQQADLLAKQQGTPPPPSPHEDRINKAGNEVVQEMADVGENLWYNRRNFTGQAIGWGDIKDLNPTLKVKEAVKAKVWPRPDYEALVEGGMNPTVASIIKSIYDALPTKPHAAGVPDDTRLQRYMDVMGRIRDATFEWARDRDALRQMADQAADIAQKRLRNAFSYGGVSDEVRNAILERVWPGEMDKPRAERWTDPAVRSETAALGRKAIQGLQIQYAMIEAATRRVTEGWPAKQEAWQRRFEIKETPAGERVVENGFTVIRRVPEFFIVKKGSRRILDAGFLSREAAIEKAREMARRSSSGGGDLRGMNITEATRTGPERRANDENISAERLMQEFGFRGVNFGRTSWINHAERQAFVNGAYDALVDLAEILGVPAKALSFNGLLGIAFGAQGRGGKAAAHFVPGVNEINLTKTAGAGTLAHEWGHALDHYFAVQAGEQYAKQAEPYMSTVVAGNFRSEGVRPAVAMAFKQIREAMRERPMTAEEQAKFDENARVGRTARLEQWLKYVRDRMQEIAKYRAEHGKTKDDKEALETLDSILENFDALAARARKGDLGDGYVMAGKKSYPDVVAQMRMAYKSATGRLLEPDAMNGLSFAAIGVKSAIARQDASESHAPQMRDTDYLQASRAKDRDKGGKGYWAQDTEMFARAFELWVDSQLKAREQENTFLSDAGLRQQDQEYPYPRGFDQERIEKAFTSLVKQLETRTTGQGTELYSNPFGPMLRAVNGLFDSIAARTTGRVYDAMAAKMAFMTPLKDLPSQSLYRQKRGLTGGKLETIDELARQVYDTFKGLNPADAMAVYTYLTTKDAPLPDVEQRVARTAQAVKRTFNVLGQQMIRLGLISREAFEKYQDSYLPRLYLRHVLEMGGFGVGMRTSDLGQTKRRKEIDPAVRELILGEIKDPAFLASFGITRTARDIAILELLNDIAQYADWVPSSQLIRYNGRTWSPVAALHEAATLRRNADYTTDETAREAMRTMARELQDLADTALADAPTDRSKYKQVPDSPRYGLLRGLWVRAEIYDDLIGGMGFVPAEASDLQRFFSAAGGAGQVTRWFKWGKVAAYPPAQFRNVFGNMILTYLSGVPLDRMLVLTGKVFQDWRTNGPISQAMRQYGVFRSTFTAQEMQRVEREWLDFRKRMAAGQGGAKASAWAIADGMATIANGFSDAYQFAEAMFKGVKIAHELERGTPLPEAVQEAQKWLFDYSEVPAWLRYSRNAPIGTPFLTWTYKIAPRLAEVALKHPQRFIPFMILPHVLAAFMQAAFDIDDDDLERLQETLPNWLRDKGGAMFLPWLDSNGRWQAIDVGYILPWYNFELVARQLARGNPGEALSQVSIAQGPGRAVIDAMSNHDSFRDMPIYRPEDTTATRYGKLTAHLWSAIAPTMLTPSSFVFRSLEPTGLVVPDSVREPITAGQAAVRPFGLNVYPINVSEQRKRNLGQYKAQLAELDRRWRSKVRRAPAEKREQFRRDWIEERTRFVREMQDYARRSAPTQNIVNPKRREQRPEA